MRRSAKAQAGSAPSDLRTRRFVRTRLVGIVALLIGLVVIGLYAPHVTSETTSNNVSGTVYGLDSDTLDQVASGNHILVKSHGDVAYFAMIEQDAANGDNKTVGFIYVTTDTSPSWSYGYSGPITILASIDTKGVVQGVYVLSQYEDRPREALKSAYLSQMVGKSVLEGLKYGEDIDTATGATYTAMAVVAGIREGGKAVLQDAGYVTIPPLPWTEQVTETIQNLTTTSDYLESLVLLSLVALAAVALSKKAELARYGVLLASLLFVGVWKTRMISIMDIVNLRNFLLPPLYGNLYWYVLFGSALFMSLYWGRLYCGWICPFGALTEFLSKLLVPKVKVPVSIESKVSALRYVVLATVIGSVVITGDLAVSGVEPFATVFLAEGATWMWQVLVTVLMISLLLDRAFCRYLCPTGAVLALLARLRLYEIRRWPECSSCSICQEDCSFGAVRGARISPTRCLNCGICEGNYTDHKACPHWLRSKRQYTSQPQFGVTAT